MGYGESKYLAERILDHAAKKLHITTAAARVGQIAGTAENPRGWNRRERFPSLVMSSKFLGVIPETLGLGEEDSDGIDWVPIDQLVEVLSELVLGLKVNNRNEGIQIFHPIHPAPTNWKSLLPAVKDALAASDSVESQTISYRDWVKRLRDLIEPINESMNAKESENVLQKNPGVKLLDLYESLRRRLAKHRRWQWRKRWSQASR